MTDEILIAGVGMTPFGRHPDLSVKELARLAVEEALADGGFARERIEAAFFANCVQGHMEGQHMIRGQIALRAMGLQRLPVINVENACASGATALHLAAQYLRAGAADVALAVGVEKMWSPDKARMMAAFDGAWDVHDVERIRRRLLAMGEGVEVPADTTSSRPYSVFMDVYAAFCRLHMRLFGTTRAQIAAVAAKNHGHSVHNPRAQYRKPFTVEEVLAADPVTWPLTVPMCAPVSDGAAAAVLCTARGLQRSDGIRSRAVRLLASVLQTGTDRQAEDVQAHLTARAARAAYEQAGIGPADLSVAEVHDATAMGEIIQVENLGLCAPGEGGRLAERGETALGGRIPVNPSGGLECKGHPIGATGLGQVFELVTQLRGEAGARQIEGARLAVAENGGGIVGVEEAVACITLLGR